MRALAAAVLLPGAAGHGMMMLPSPRFPSMTTSLWFNEGCQIGCPNCTDDQPDQGGKCGFGKPCCANPAKPTITDPALLTFPAFSDLGLQHSPWRAPGSAPVYSPCGLAGGGSVESLPNGAVAPPGVKQGKDGRDGDATGPKATWAAGSEQEVSWAIAANHGGGYSYRLCPTSGKVTEECFQSGHLDFVGDTSWVQYPGNRTAITAVQVSEGTTPAGSQWRKLMMPTCKGFGAGYHARCDTYQKGFPPPPELPTWYGSGAQNACATYPEGWPASKNDSVVVEHCAPFFNFTIVDKVSVPKDLTPGEYMLSWRWDCEQTPQIWANCADITITA